MKEIYDNVSTECSKLITKTYSTSFTLGIRAFDKKFRTPIYNIYGFVRLADEIVDSFHDYDKIKLLDQFIESTFTAIENRISLNPVLHSFQQTVHAYNLDHSHIEAFLESMKMDLLDIKYDDALLKKYIYGSAEVIGLMCLKVFCQNNEEQYKELEPYARSLGSAFQKINFLRDIKDDYYNKGRIYFPNLNPHKFTISDKKVLEEQILEEFNHAYIGIGKLPKGAKTGVLIAYRYYTSLLLKIKKVSSEEILQKRIRINDFRKMWIFVKYIFKDFKLNPI